MKQEREICICLFILIFTIHFLVCLVPAEESDTIISIETDQDYYNLGEKIKINGTINKVDVSFITVLLEKNDFRRVKNIHVTNRSFNLSYIIRYGDPDGLWNISANLPGGNESLSNSVNINVGIPEDIIRYHLIWFSPVPNASYPRGSQINFSIFVTEDLEGVSNSSVHCFLPTLERILLPEIKRGYYQQNYTIPWNSSLGEWCISSECVKTVNDIMYFGGNRISFSIIPATLELIFLDQIKKQYMVNEATPIRLKIQYPDGTSVDKATLSLNFDTETFQLVSDGEGIYSLNDSISFSNPGSSVLTIEATDSFGNQVFFHKVLTIIPENTKGFFMLFLYGFLIVTGGICVLFIFFRKKLLGLIRWNADVEIEEIKHLQKETAKKYYITGDISREIYDSLKKEYIQRLEELKYSGPLKKTMLQKMIYFFRRRKDDI